MGGNGHPFLSIPIHALKVVPISYPANRAGNPLAPTGILLPKTGNATLLGAGKQILDESAAYLLAQLSLTPDAKTWGHEL